MRSSGLVVVVMVVRIRVQRSIPDRGDDCYFLLFLSVSSKSPGPFPFISLPPQLSSYSGMRTQNQNEKGLKSGLPKNRNRSRPAHSPSRPAWGWT